MIRIKGIFANRSAMIHAVVFVYFLLFGFVLSSIFGFAIMSVSGILSGNVSSNALDMPFYAMHVMQFAASLFLFALPAFGTAYCCSHNPAKFLCTEKIATGKALLLASAMLLLAFPAIDIAAYFNSKMTFPDFMAPVEKWMRETEDFSANVTERLLSAKGFFPFAANILIIGVTAGVTEELLFRGALLSIIRKKIKNPHVAIWIAAILFSAFHFQFYGFIPRMLLGALLGYLLYWSHSIWVPVFIHFLNNTLALVGYKTGINEDISGNSTFITDTTGTEEWLCNGAIAIAGLLLLGFCAKKIKKICAKPEEDT